MQNTSIGIIFVVYTYCIFIFVYVMCVCTLFYDTVYKCNIVNAAEKHLILREHFTLNVDILPLSLNCICDVSEVCK